MSVRELVLLGTASQVPTRERNQNGYLLRWDGQGVLFDPGEGTQRQLTRAGVSAASITRICITHFHGDHCLGLPGIVQRLSLDGVSHPVEVFFPASGVPYFERLVGAAIYQHRVDLRPRPLEGGETVDLGDLRLACRPLDHRVDTLGWRLEEPEGRTMLADRLREVGVSGAEVGRLKRAGSIEVKGRRVRVEEVSAPRPGQRFAFVMDTGLCAAAVDLARNADLLLCEATFLSEDADLATEYKHMTATDAARLARDAGVRRLILTHFSQRYANTERFGQEAREIFDHVIVGEDLLRVAVPPRVSSRP
ncbi:MAG: ribonuclease Z [Actinomycetota bacterium]|nr:ribonuclease Z [Actinomycetota bacterium]